MFFSKSISKNKIIYKKDIYLYIIYMLNNTIYNNTNKIYLTQGYIIGLIIFALYLELNPKIGNVWYRIDENNEYQVKPSNILEYFVKPFKDRTFWKPRFWDINPYTFSTIASLTFTGIRKIIDFIH